MTTDQNPQHNDWDLIEEKLHWKGALFALGIVIVVFGVFFIPWLVGVARILKWIF